MKVGYFVETPVEHNLTGGSRSFLDLVEQLVPMGVEPFVVVSEPWALTEELSKRGIPYITTKMYRPFVGVTKKARLYRTKYLIKCIVNHIATRRAVSFFKSNEVQLIHIKSQFCGLVGAQVAHRMNLPYIYHIREYLSSDFGVRFFNEKKASELIGGANVIIAISKSIEEYEKKKYPNSNVIRVYNGLNFNRAGCPDRECFTEELIKLVIVGRVTDSKNQKDAVNAVDILVHKYNRNVKLYIVGYMGTDPYEINLKKYVEEHGLEKNVEFVPFTNNPNEITQQCDIGLMCSLREAFGRVTIEYMMANLLVIGSNTGGTPELINGEEDGILYKLGKPDEIADKVNWAILNKENANRIIAKGKKKAIENFSITNTAKKVFQVYEGLVR